MPYRPFSGTFPYPCAAGYLGSNESEYQRNANCAGKCPAGLFCPTAVTIDPEDCPAGSYCPAGSTAATEAVQPETYVAVAWISAGIPS